MFAHEIHPMSLCLWTFSHVFPIDRDVRFLCLVDSRLLALRAWGSSLDNLCFYASLGAIAMGVGGRARIGEKFSVHEVSANKGISAPILLPVLMLCGLLV